MTDEKDLLLGAALKYIELAHPGHNRSCRVPACFPCEILERAGRRQTKCQWNHGGSPCMVNDQIGEWCLA
jgi:hypothetical protein